MKAVVAAFNQDKALVGAFSVITNLQMELFQALLDTGATSTAEPMALSISPSPVWSSAVQSAQSADSLLHNGRSHDTARLRCSDILIQLPKVDIHQSISIIYGGEDEKIIYTIKVC